MLRLRGEAESDNDITLELKRCRVRHNRKMRGVINIAGFKQTGYGKRKNYIAGILTEGVDKGKMIFYDGISQEFELILNRKRRIQTAKGV
jgi:hypothetical protein